jgi:P pilus assembly chaperone PapD
VKVVDTCAANEGKAAALSLGHCGDPLNIVMFRLARVTCCRLSIAATVLLAGLAVSPAIAQITVSRSVIEFTPESRVQDVEIVNTGGFRMYLDLAPAEILKPESDNPQRIELDDPRSAAVIVSPRQLLLPPGQRKRVRMILRDDIQDTERVFRLSVKPYTGKVNLHSDGDAEKTSAIKVLVGYDLLLLARPSSLKPKLDVIRTDKEIEFRNAGNTNVLLRKITQCDADGTGCVELNPNRLYVGETYKVALPKPGSANETPVKVQRSVGLENSNEVY